MRKTFAAFCRRDRNSKFASTTYLLERDRGVPFARYFESLRRCKHFSHWRARLNAVHMPVEATMACRVPQEAGRLLVIMFIHNAAPRDAIAADLKSRGHWIDGDLERWLEA